MNRRVRGLAMVLSLAIAVDALPAAAKPVAHRQQGSVEARNKAIVLAMWHAVIDGRNIENAPRYIARDYIQHSPGVGQGLAAVMAFLRKEFSGSKPLAKGTYPLTTFEFVMAEGDLVQLMFKRRLPSRTDPARMTDIWWYDTYRVRDGMIVEHWDSASD